jgi:hypothetical protein
MSDPALELGPALAAWLRADTEVVAAFGSNTVRILDKLPQPNTDMPYVTIDGLDVDDDSAECLDASQVVLNIGVWSLPNDGDKAEARRMAKAIKTAILRMQEDVGNSPEFSISGFRVVAAQYDRTAYLVDPSDNKTIHAVINATLSVDPT